VEKKMAQIYGPFEAEKLIPLWEDPKSINQKGEVLILSKNNITVV